MGVAKESFLQSSIAALNTLSSSSTTSLYDASTALLEEFKDAIENSSQSMLPSYLTSLPSPKMSGTAIATDLGGSTFRVAAIQLRPHKGLHGADAEDLGRLRNVLVRNSWSVGDEVKQLKAKEFFDWIAERVDETVQEAGLKQGSGKSLGVAWSFPVAYALLFIYTRQPMDSASCI